MHKLPDINNAFSDWYQEVIYQAELVDQSPVRGTMVVRPYGCAIWDNIKAQLDTRIKQTGHHNALFPLFIPESFLKREAQHIEGFAPELAVVTHAGGKQLEEPLVVRPTSETIVHYMFARWIKSWRDLPLKINQWANVVRWELRPRPFVRTTEFFWQEGHTAHETLQEATQETHCMLQEYVDLCHNYLAIPVIVGQKTQQEKFPGAQMTLTFEGIMQDGKALQMGTSHLLSQSFAHSFDMKYQDRNGNYAYPFLTSWGATTRLVGAVIMVHGDQKGLIIPPRIAPIHVIIIPIYKTEEDKAHIQHVSHALKDRLTHVGLRVDIDDSTTKSPGTKFYKWELKGVPIRVEIGPRDIANNQVTVVTRIDGAKKVFALDAIEQEMVQLLDALHNMLFEKALHNQKSKMHIHHKVQEFGPQLEKNNGGYRTSWCGNNICENELKPYKASIRCITEGDFHFATCFFCNEVSIHNVLIAKSY